MKTIWIVGFMGAGKSTVGQALARRLGWTFIDLDDEIEAAAGAKISAIFAERGEPGFRALETEALRRLTERPGPHVIALGGGAFTIEANRELLRGHGTTVWLDCPYETVVQRVATETKRPLARDPARFADLYRTRRQSYELADIRIPIACDDPEVAVEAILSRMEAA